MSGERGYWGKKKILWKWVALKGVVAFILEPISSEPDARTKRKMAALMKTFILMISQLTEFYYYFLTAAFIPEAIAGPSRLTPAQQPAAPFVPEAIAGPSRLVPAQPSAIAGPSRLAPPEPMVDEPTLPPRARSRSPVANRPSARSRSPIADPARRRSPAPVRRQGCPRSPPRHMRSEKEEAAHAKKNKFAFLREALERARARREQERLWRENPALRPTRRARSTRPSSDHQMAFMPDTVARRWRMEPQPLRRFPNVDR
ncbi:hypothetical protein JTE90_026183 [Oedothorax gibbosus]|uniref:Uncharacterized protein n=1 Tax=Oedothorax gibbosus TaxID=931172 RepID=A0AAV6UEW3_9ARAC|nr:hypothetical protein JTE90_026183 [Oedothorax gibbosus]